MKNKLFLAILVLAALLRVAWIGSAPFWYDENFTLLLSRLPFGRMLAATAADVHPPLWYLITWLILHAAPSAPEWVLRLPAMLASLLSLFVLRDVMHMWILPMRVQVGAMLLMALLPFQVWYAQEARMYALLELEVLLALWYALRGHWVGLFGAATAMLYTQNYAVFYLESLWTVILLRDPRKMPHVTVSLASAGVFYLPWVRIVESQMQSITGRYWIQPQALGDVLNILNKLFWNASMPSFALLSGLIVTFLALLLGGWYMVRSRHPAVDAISVMAFAPVALASLVSFLWQPVLLHRPLIGIAPFLYIIASWAFDRIFHGNRLREMVMSAALIVPVLVSGLGGYYANVAAMKNDGAVTPLRGALAYVEANWREGDVIYFTDDGPMVGIRPYTDRPQYQMPACGERMNTGPVLGSLTPATREALGIEVRPLEDVPHLRAWIFAPMSPLHPRCYEEQIRALLPGQPIIVVDDNQFIVSGVWLVLNTDPL